ncbi:hypothetical protein CHS0354_002068 [Potamilus streckersoni]|uniref:Metallo-beta-lactamase domain-containing protein n=1 Tax=Potamilus streckersoni TaxID=2493646 RepID=A0AAE0W8L8_9BIVA|nr:hypothetical protein CHS0354_002068 [Potamilus streckersoni]
MALPVMVYLLGISPVQSTVYSLFTVGTVSALGALNYIRNGRVNLKSVITFAVPSFITVYITRRLIVPEIPPVVWEADNFQITRETAVMLLFAVLMMAAAVFMIRSRETDRSDADKGTVGMSRTLLIAAEGAGVGMLTGILGAGGGFLIIPSLVLLSKLTMKEAVGTSLTIIAINSLTGFIGDIHAGQYIDWLFLLSFTGIAMAGIFVGSYFSGLISEQKLKNYSAGIHMKIEQIYTGCLAQGSYYIHSKGEGVVIDPLREVTPYLERAKADNVRIKYIFETHFHADFVSGHVTLAEKTGAQIVYGPGATPAFKAHTSKDGEIFKVGDITFKLLHTPGHTMESSVFLLSDEQGREHAVFTGDTLFLGDVGRPDLAQKGAELTQEDLASYLYDSLRKKIMPLPDSVIVYPAHGAGSACGKNMMKETYDTLGNQKK